jgi:hypothetical protein
LYEFSFRDLFPKPCQGKQAYFTLKLKCFTWVYFHIPNQLS